MRSFSPAPSAVAAVVGCVATVLFCIAVVDRPAATWSHAQFSGHDTVFRGLTHIVDPLLPSAGLGLAVAAVAGSCGWRPRRAGHTLIACCFAVLVSYAIKEQLKFDFGRLWPETWVDGNPSWIHDGAYGFFPFHGKTGWSSFPSGHMTAITAPVAVLWAQWPRWRPILSMPVILVAVGLYGADFHFVGDMAAGCCLGAACGIGVLVVLRSDWLPLQPARS